MARTGRPKIYQELSRTSVLLEDEDLKILQAVAKSKNVNLAMVIRDLLKPKCEKIRKSAWWINLNLALSVENLTQEKYWDDI